MFYLFTSANAYFPKGHIAVLHAFEQWRSRGIDEGKAQCCSPDTQRFWFKTRWTPLRFFLKQEMRFQMIRAEEFLRPSTNPDSWSIINFQRTNNKHLPDTAPKHKNQFEASYHSAQSPDSQCCLEPGWWYSPGLIKYIGRKATRDTNKLRKLFLPSDLSTFQDLLITTKHCSRLL